MFTLPYFTLLYLEKIKVFFIDRHSGPLWELMSLAAERSKPCSRHKAMHRQISIVQCTEHCNMLLNQLGTAQFQAKTMQC